LSTDQKCNRPKAGISMTAWHPRAADRSFLAPTGHGHGPRRV